MYIPPISSIFGPGLDSSNHTTWRNVGSQKWPQKRVFLEEKNSGKGVRV